VVLHDGVITERGTHEELIAARGDYYQLVRNQLELNA
jgi:ATP-binding cassette subfamily B protein